MTALVLLPTTSIQGQVWLNPDYVVFLELAEEGRSNVYVVGTQYVVTLPPEDVAALLRGQTPT